MDDCGGGYSESITEMCDELQNGSLPLLIPTPNGRDDAGTNRDCFLLNPVAKSPLHMNMFRFLGKAAAFALKFLGKAAAFALRFLGKAAAFVLRFLGKAAAFVLRFLGKDAAFVLRFLG